MAIPLIGVGARASAAVASRLRLGRVKAGAAKVFGKIPSLAKKGWTLGLGALGIGAGIGGGAALAGKGASSAARDLKRSSSGFVLVLVLVLAIVFFLGRA